MTSVYIQMLPKTLCAGGTWRYLMRSTVAVPGNSCVVWF